MNAKEIDLAKESSAPGFVYSIRDPIGLPRAMPSGYPSENPTHNKTKDPYKSMKRSNTFIFESDIPIIRCIQSFQAQLENK